MLQEDDTFTPGSGELLYRKGKTFSKKKMKISLVFIVIMYIGV